MSTKNFGARLLQTSARITASRNPPAPFRLWRPPRASAVSSGSLSPAPCAASSHRPSPILDSTKACVEELLSARSGASAAARVCLEAATSASRTRALSARSAPASLWAVRACVCASRRWCRPVHRPVLVKRFFSSLRVQLTSCTLSATLL